MVKSWFNKILPSLGKQHKEEKKSPVPQGLWQTCSNCKEILYGPDLEANMYVCPNCDHHIRIGARHRISYLIDHDEYVEKLLDDNPDYEKYGWRTNMCYGTKEHREQIIINGDESLVRSIQSVDVHDIRDVKSVYQDTSTITGFAADFGGDVVLQKTAVSGLGIADEVQIATNGVITGTTITNPGFGYTNIAVPQVLAPLPNAIKEDIDTITTIQGFDGAITGIGVTGGIGHPTALKFNISADLTNNPNSVLTDLKVGYPIYIFGTQVGHGVTSVVSDNSTVVATGTTCVDNIYFINAFNSGVGIITCNIMTGVNTTGINGATVGFGTGGFSWGRLSGFSRGSNPISIGVTGLTIDSGLSTYPTIQRRDFGLRNTGSLRKDLG